MALNKVTRLLKYVTRLTSWYDVISPPELIILLDIVTRAFYCDKALNKVTAMRICHKNLE